VYSLVATTTVLPNAWDLKLKMFSFYMKLEVVMVVEAWPTFRTAKPLASKLKEGVEVAVKLELKLKL